MPRQKRQAVIKTIQTKAIKEINTALKLEEVDEFGKPKFIRCKCCNRIKKVSDYFTCYSPNNKTGYAYICKECCKMMSLDESGTFNAQKVYKLCEMIDKPFINKIFNKISEMAVASGTAMNDRNKIGIYVKMVNSSLQGFRTCGFENSEEIIVNTVADDVEAVADSKVEENIKLWGDGWTPEEYTQLNLLYNDYLNNYPLKTVMHQRSLLEVCKDEVRFSYAVAKNDREGAKFWGDLLSKAKTNAKINPSQLSAADLSDGISAFSQLSQAVERAQDIIPLLKKYTARPLDRVDYTIYMILDYLRDLEGKSHITYKEVWQYIYNQQPRNSKEFGADVVPNENAPSPNAILVDGEV